jgi:hypothetical protein
MRLAREGVGDVVDGVHLDVEQRPGVWSPGGFPPDRVEALAQADGNAVGARHVGAGISRSERISEVKKSNSSRLSFTEYVEVCCGYHGRGGRQPEVPETKRNRQKGSNWPTKDAMNSRFCW